MTDELVLKYDPNTIEHLGISLYSKLPSVLSELVSNSWDADADKISIEFLDLEDEKEIIYSDNGEGMSFEELQEKYLVIGRNRRKQTPNITSKGRKVIGKKGLGKLSVFGICDVIQVTSIKNGLMNQFSMDLLEIKNSKTQYYKPQILHKKVPTKDKSGIIIKLQKIRRKKVFELEKIALSLSKKFIIFSELYAVLVRNNTEETIVTNDLKYKNTNIEFVWSFPDEKFDDNYEFWNKIEGSIFTLETPVKDTEMRGIFLTSRGKIVNTAEFYEARDNDQFHSYVSGYLNVDFIDDFEEDVISTDRSSLNWENEKTKELQLYLQLIIKKIGSEWRNRRAEEKKKLIKSSKQLDIDEWQNRLPEYERELSKKIVNPILENATIDLDNSSQIIGSVIDKFDNITFKRYASDISEITNPEDLPKLLKLMDDWKAIEAKEIKDLANARIEVIKQFENYLNTNTKEVPTLHNFLKKFSWLLDPRILEFRDEVTYSTLLKESFPEDELDEKNKRIDFLCSNALGEILYVIEIKRSQYRVGEKAIEQAYRYGTFLKNKYASSTGFSKVVCYVVGGEKHSEDYNFKAKEDTYMKSGEVFVKTYRELLEQSKEYHKEFIKAYEKYH